MSSSSNSSNQAVSFESGVALRKLSELASQIRTHAQDLAGYELILGDENIFYAQSGADTVTETIQNLLRASFASSSSDSPLFTREVRHDLRNHIAVVKGFSDLMMMDVPPEHPSVATLQQVLASARDFVEVLDAAKDRATTSDSESLPIAS